MKRSILGAAALVTATLLTTLVPSRTNAEVVAYSTAVDGGLYSVDLTTATATLIGNTGVALMEGLALSPGGALFGTSDSGTLYSINATTGVATSIGSTSLGDVEGLSFNGSTLIGSNFTNGATSLYTINTSTAAATLLLTPSPAVPVIRALTFTNSTTALVANGSGGNETLSSINLTTGASAVLGAFNPSSVFAPAMAANPGGSVYVLDGLGNEYTISLTGNLTLVGNTGNQFYLDMTIAPNSVPEPSTCILAGMAVAFGLGGAWLRRRRSA
jgi:MYXO-CTERM domain-containing protein